MQTRAASTAKKPMGVKQVKGELNQGGLVVLLRGGGGRGVMCVPVCCQ